MKLIDLHCDTITKMHNDKEPDLFSNKHHVDIQKLKESDFKASFFAVYADKIELENKKINPFNYFKEALKTFDRQIKKNLKHIAYAKSYKEFSENMHEDRISAFISIEGGCIIGGDTDLIDRAYECGVRLITLLWNYENSYGYPNMIHKFSKLPLKEEGIKAIEKMNEKGIIIDVSHMSDGGFFSVANTSKKPFAASHSGARSIFNHPRNLTDEMISIIGQKGGVAGVNFCPDFLNKDKNSNAESIVLHIEKIVNKGGIECAAIGSDFDGIKGNMEIKDAGRMDILYNYLRKKGFSEGKIDKIFYKNAVRLIKDVLN